MANPSTQIIATWIQEYLVQETWVPLRETTVEVLSVKWGRSQDIISEFLEEKLEHVAEHLRNDLADCATDGRVREYEIDNESPPYIRRIALRDKDLIDKLRVINPFTFEEVCSKILSALGAESGVTQRTHDGGVDFFATKLKVVPTTLPMPISCHGTVVGQAKRYQAGSLISETRLREFVGASLLERHKLSSNAALGPLVPTIYAFWTTADLDQNAKVFARNVGLWYMDGPTLAAYVTQLGLREYVMNLPS